MVRSDSGTGSGPSQAIRVGQLVESHCPGGCYCPRVPSVGIMVEHALGALGQQSQIVLDGEAAVPDEGSGLFYG